MLLKQDASAQKLSGSYFTPRIIAEYITRWALNQDHIRNILEPSCGDGVFLKCISTVTGEREHQVNLGNIPPYHTTAVEIDQSFSKLAAKNVNHSMWFDKWENFESPTFHQKGKEPEVDVINDDFYTAYKNGLKDLRFEAIIGNPPYIRYQYLTEEQRNEQSRILVNNGMRANKLINAWVTFTVACVSCMNANSRIGLVVPAELLQVKYSEELRQYLVRKLNRLTVITFKSLIFDGIEQEVVLLLGEKTADLDTHQIRIVQCYNADDLPCVNTLDEIPFYDEDNDAIRKWTRYFLNPEQEDLLHNIERDQRYVRFSDIARVEVGITTGNNKYFCVDNATVERYNLRPYCLPLIARSVNIKGVVFTHADWQDNIKQDARTYLLNLAPFVYQTLNDGVKSYIKYGEDKEMNLTYKCQIRDEWYKVPSVWSPDAFFLRRNYLYPKFMLNSPEVNAVSTDTMHRVRFKRKNIEKRAIVAYYNSLALTYTEIEGRSYGGGVLEILPGEVSKIVLPDIFDPQVINDREINELVNTIDQYIRRNIDIEGLLDITDKVILMGVMNMTAREVKIIRNAWLSLRRRRLERGGYEK